MTWTTRDLTALLAILVLATSVFLPPRPASAADGAKKEGGPTIQGVVKSVNSGQKPVAVTLTVMADKASKKTEEKTFPLAATVTFVREEATSKDKPAPAGELADLIPGSPVTLRLDPDGKTVVAVSTRGPSLNGRITAIDPARKNLTVTTKESGGLKEYKLELGKDAKVIVDDGLGKKGDAPQEGKPADLTEDANVIVQVSVDRKTALSVRLQGASLNGSVKGYDAGNRTLTLTVKEDAQVVDKTLTLAPGAKIDGDLTEGKSAAVRLSVKDKTIVVAVRVVKE